MNMSKQITLSIFAAALLVPGCKSDKRETGSGTETKVTEGATGTVARGKVGGEVIKIDGSSTVFPITQAVAEEFQIERGGRVTVGTPYHHHQHLVFPDLLAVELHVLCGKALLPRNRIQTLRHNCFNLRLQGLNIFVQEAARHQFAQAGVVGRIQAEQ